MDVKVCSVASGSNGNCTHIGFGSTNILVDCGLSGKNTQERLELIGVDPKKIGAILVTHEHSDHTNGVGILSRRFNIPIFATEGTWKSMDCKIGKISSNNTNIIKEQESFSLGDVLVKPYSISHDARQPVGYTLKGGGKKVALATDLGIFNDEIERELEESDLIVLESNHDIEMLKSGPYPWHLKVRIMSDKGHLSNVDAGNLIAKLVTRRVKRVILAHLSEENNIPALALKTIESILASKGICVNKDVEIGMSYRHRPGEVYSL